jgi:hypothetical protein
MSIKFICSCGKHLRARDEMAARRSVCPQCGAPVGIPSRQATHRGAAAGPLSPLEKLTHRRVVPSLQAPPDNPTPAGATTDSGAGPPLPQPDDEPRVDGERHARWRLDAALVRLVFSRKQRSWRRQRPLETHWHECFLYPLQGLPIVVGQAVGLAALTVGIVFLTPEIMEIQAEGAWLLLLCWPYLLIPLALFGYASSWLDCALISAATGGARQPRWPVRHIGLALKSSLIWLFCFLAGPIIPASVGVLYWIDCGEPALVDWLILAELGILTAGHWLFALLAVCLRERLRDASPARVIELIHRMGYRAAIVILVAAAVVLTHGLLALFAIMELHRTFPLGCVLLVGCWASGLFVGTFLFRLLGVWCYRSGSFQAEPQSAAHGAG